MDKYKAALIAIVLVGSLAFMSTYIMQPMSLLRIVFRIDPGFGTHPMEYIRRAFINGPEMVAFSNPLKLAGIVIVRGIPSVFIRNGARIF